VVISKKDGYITSLKIAGDNQEFLNRAYIDANGSKAGCKFLLLFIYLIIYFFIIIKNK